MGKTIRIVDVAPAQDRCQNIRWNRSQALRDRQSAQRRSAANREVKAYRESDGDTLGMLWEMRPTD